ncbi:MAG: beta-N-acetylhexosaminidase [Rhodospirillaceae bacterium]|nr:beta-N-acetylhexosaminidase [Rhodospirillaceae bacterium]
MPVSQTAAAPRAAIFGLKGLTLNDAERAFFKRVRPLGYILFARNVEDPAQVLALVNDLRSLNPDLDPVVLIDQEGGRVQRLKPPYWRPAPTGAEFAALYATDADAAARHLRANFQLIGEELRALGIDVDCAPVMDVPVPGAHDVIGDRAYGTDPATVYALARQVCEGLIDAGVVPVIKHIPGHGRAMSDSHLELPRVGADLAALRATDFAPFRAFCAAPDQPVAFGMTAHVVYEAIDPDRPATTSRRMIEDIIRGEIGFQGLLMSDDLGMKALSGPYDERAARSLSAGCDAVLHCDGNMDDMEAVARGTGLLGERGLKALKDTAAIRRRPRAVMTDGPAADFKIMTALRRG